MGQGLEYWWGKLDKKYLPMTDWYVLIPISVSCFELTQLMNVYITYLIIFNYNILVKGFRFLESKQTPKVTKKNAASLASVCIVSN